MRQRNGKILRGRESRWESKKGDTGLGQQRVQQEGGWRMKEGKGKGEEAKNIDT